MRTHVFLAVSQNRAYTNFAQAEATPRPVTSDNLIHVGLKLLIMIRPKGHELVMPMCVFYHHADARAYVPRLKGPNWRRM